MSETLHMDNNYEPPSFPQFPDLPAELRLRVWEFFCKGLADGPRVFRVKLATEASDITGDVPYSIQPTSILRQQTAAARTALAISRESRDEALKLLPDTFTVNDGTGVVRFTARRDVVLLDGEFNAPWMRSSWNHHIEGFSDHIVNLALGTDFMAFRTVYLGRNPEDMVHTTWFLLLFLNPFTQLKTVYCCGDDWREDRHLKRWCASDLVNRYHFSPDRRREAAAVAPGSGDEPHPEPEPMMCCWLDHYPKAESSDDSSMEDLLFTSELGPTTAEIRNKVQLLLGSSRWSQETKARIHRVIEPLSEDDLWRLSGIDMRKMIIFSSLVGLHRFYALDPISETMI